MRVLLLSAIIAIASSFNVARAAMVYTSGHADIGVAFEDGGLHLHMHAEGPLGQFGTNDPIPPGEYDADSFVIGVPGPSLSRPAGDQWNFLSGSQGDQVWLLPQGSQADKPFLGIAAEEGFEGNGWTNPVQWSIDSITPIVGNPQAFSLYQTDEFGTPDVFASTLQSDTEWTQPVGGHDHYFYGFTEEGIYDFTITASVTNSANTTFTDTQTFRFAVGDSAIALAAVPEPSSAVLLGLCGVAGLVRRRRK